MLVAYLMRRLIHVHFINLRAISLPDWECGTPYRIMQKKG